MNFRTEPTGVTVSQRLIQRRRATILLMVVSILALLFVIITGFLSLGQLQKKIGDDRRRGAMIDAVVGDAVETVVSRVGEQVAETSGDPAVGVEPATIPGYRTTRWLGAVQPVWNEGAVDLTTDIDTGSLSSTANWQDLGRVVWPAMTNLDGGPDARPQPMSILDLIVENPNDNDDDLARFDLDNLARNPWMDADGDGVPDTFFLRNLRLTENANEHAGTPVALRGVFSDTFLRRTPASTTPIFGLLSQLEALSRFQETARYVVSARTFSNGGLVALDSVNYIRNNNGQIVAFPPNRNFIVGMFDALRQFDNGAIALANFPTASENALFDQLRSYSSLVEPLLRRRNGLPPWPGDTNPNSGIGADRPQPLILSFLEGRLTQNEIPELAGIVGYRRTFVPSYRVGNNASAKGETWQRFNVADPSNNPGRNERAAFANATALRTGVYNRSSGIENAPPLLHYERRPLLTTISNSDDLARKQDTVEPTTPRPVTGTYSPEPYYPGKVIDGNRYPQGPFRPMGTTIGDQKFWLGEIAKCFEEINPVSGARVASGSTNYYRYVPYRQIGSTVVKVGDAVVERLADIYYDMLGGHSGTGDEWGSDGDLPGNNPAAEKQAVTRRQQALMLAVNTVQFAAPRADRGIGDPYSGFVDTVWYTDWSNAGTVPGPASKWDEYVGYAPQPVITELVAFNDGDRQTPRDRRIAVAVELFNPSDPSYVGTTDVFALNLDDYAISINGYNPNQTPTTPTDTRWRRLAGVGGSIRLPGRSFFPVIIQDTESGNSNSHFDSRAHAAYPPIKLEIPNDPTTAPRNDDDELDSRPIPIIQIDLWRRGWRPTSAGMQLVWYQIDRMAVRYPQNAQRFNAAYRDTTPTAYMGNLGGIDRNGDGSLDYARWATVVNRIRNIGELSGPAISAIGSPLITALASGTTNPDSMTFGFAPHAPLITMNAGPTPGNAPLFDRLNDLPMFGNASDVRPRSFPTPGFLLYVPRFSHFMRVDTTPPTPPAVDQRQRFTCASATLARQWRNQNSTGTPSDPPDVSNFDGVPTNDYACDFGHMPIFDNRQKSPGETATAFNANKLPWGLFVFDYFTTSNPAVTDPLRVPGRIDLNAAPWYVMSKLPVLGPTTSSGQSLTEATAPAAQLPIRRSVNASGQVSQLIPTTVSAGDPSPAFWDPACGVVVGVGVHPAVPGAPIYRLRTPPSIVSTAPSIWLSGGVRGEYRLGAWLAQSAASYRDGVQYNSESTSDNAAAFTVLANSHLRGGTGSYAGTPSEVYRLSSMYGRIRGRAYGAAGPGGPDIETDTTPAIDERPTEFGFLTVGELANVKGFDSTVSLAVLDPQANAAELARATVLGLGDFVKAASLLTLLDTHYLTTRSNTFTVHISVMDRKNPDASVLEQLTVDRSNMLPQRVYGFGPAIFNNAAQLNTYINTYGVEPPLVPTATLKHGQGEPELVARRRTAYFNARYDQ